MEWTVVTSLVVIVGLFFTVSKPIWSVLKELHTLRAQNDYQEKAINADAETVKELVKLSQSHENRLANQENITAEIRAQTSELLKVTLSHEGRISNLESKSKDKE